MSRAARDDVGGLAAPRTHLLVGESGMKVGVTGHRWNKIGRQARPALSRRLRQTFRSLDEKVPGPKTLLCGMAEGTDLCAASVRPEHWALEAILPLEPAAWRAHLAQTAGDDDAALFDRLIRDARVEVPVHGNETGYVATGIRLSEISERLIAVWDGKPGLPGGVAEDVARCRARGIPVEIIPAQAVDPSVERSG
jgi:hypothetical protein